MVFIVIIKVWGWLCPTANLVFSYFNWKLSKPIISATKSINLIRSATNHASLYRDVTCCKLKKTDFFPCYRRKE